MRGRLLLAVAAAALVVCAAPFVGEIRTVLERTLPDQHDRIVFAAVLLPGLAFVATALYRIRDRRPLRYALLVGGVGLAVVYTQAMETPLTEQFHFTEYGLVALLFYRAWRSTGDVTSVVLPVCATLIAAFADEWFQWFVPSRVGEVRDVGLNGIGIVSGLLVGIAFEPPLGLGWPDQRRARRALASGVTAAVATAALFMQVVHLGYEIHDADAGTFRARQPADALIETSRQRAVLWRRQPQAPSPPLLSREDHYASEALFHVQWRNLVESRGDLWSAWKENLILEKFYRPVLEAGGGLRWADEQRAAIAAAVVSDPRPYVSEAYPLPIYAWNRLWFWSATVFVIALVWLALGRTPRPREAAVT